MKQTTFSWSLLTVCLVATLSISLASCGDDDNDKKNEQSNDALLVGVWKCSNFDGYDTYSFYEDGIGMYMKWENTPNSPMGSAKSDYKMVFSYTYSNNTLILDYGFGYIKTYRVQSLSREYLDMYLSTTNILCSRENMNDRNIFPDYASDIVATWNIADTEKAQNYIISFRADGTYESQSTSYSTITENGNYKVENSRVKLTSTNNNSLLNGRIFTITHIANVNTNAYTQGYIHLQTENGTNIIGYQRN